MTQGPGGDDNPVKPEAKKKVAKTLLFNAPKVEDTQPTAAAETKEAEATDNSVGVTKKRKVPKTLLELDKDQVMQAAEEAAKAQEQDLQEPPDQPEKAPRKVAKTMLYDKPVLPDDKLEEAVVEPISESPARSESEPAEKKAEEIIERPTKRRVAKTMLFNTIEGQPEPPAKEGYRPLSTKKIARTLLFTKSELPSITEAIDPAEAIGETNQPTVSEEKLDRAEAEKVVERYIARTMLDHSILFAQLAKTQHRQEEIAIEAAHQKALEPVKPFVPVECKKNALPCPWVWDETLSTDKYRYCSRCQRAVYNFSGMEMPEAEAMILKVENLSKFTLYKRTDGKYMTGDCAVTTKKRSDIVLLSFLAVAAICTFLVFLTTLPKPKPAPPPQVVKRKAPAKVQLYTKAPPGTPGSGHYVAGKGFVMDPPAQPSGPVVAPTPAPVTTTTDPDENGQMWEYNNTPGTRSR